MTNLKFKTINTARLTIQLFEASDIADHYVSWLNDAETVRYSVQRHLRHSRESCRAYFDAMNLRGDWFLALIRKDSEPSHIGNISVVFDRPNITADVAIMIGEKAARGQGLGFEAWTAILKYLLGPARIRKVTAGTISENKAMMSLAFRCGMIEEGRQRRQYLLDGREVDRVFFARFADGT